MKSWRAIVPLGFALTMLFTACVPQTPTPLATSTVTSSATLAVAIIPTSSGVSTIKSNQSALLTFTSGAKNTGRQLVTIQPGLAGKYVILLENANPSQSGYFMVWDYIALYDGNKAIWEIGQSEAPTDYSPTAFDEFCDPNLRSDCITDFTVDSSNVKDFSKELNDLKFPISKINFTLITDQANSNLNLILSTLYSTHDNTADFKMKVTLQPQ